jgi:hypothetical protein
VRTYYGYGDSRPRMPLLAGCDWLRAQPSENGIGFVSSFSIVACSQNPPLFSAARSHYRQAGLRHKILNHLHNQRNPGMLTLHTKRTRLSQFASQTPPDERPSPQRLIYSMHNGRKIRLPRDGNPDRGSR